MADVADAAIVVSAGTALAAIGYAVRITWKISRIEKAVRDDSDLKIKNVRDAFDAEIDNLQRDVVRLERAAGERAETLRHEFGETGGALRTKIHEVETWNRDTFVRKDSFEMVIGRLEKSLEKLGDKIEDRIERLADRLQKPD